MPPQLADMLKRYSQTISDMLNWKRKIHCTLGIGVDGKAPQDPKEISFDLRSKERELFPLHF